MLVIDRSGNSGGDAKGSANDAKQHHSGKLQKTQNGFLSFLGIEECLDGLSVVLVAFKGIDDQIVRLLMQTGQFVS